MLIYILGADGMLGHTLTKYFSSKKYQIITYNRNNYNVLTDDIQLLDIEENSIVINCIGLIPQKYQLNQISDYIKVNGYFPQLLAKKSKIDNFQLIHITTDCIYDGKDAPYDINRLPSEKNIYGMSKFLGENEKVMTIRTSIIGEEIKGKRSLLEWVRSHQNEKIEGYNNHYWNGLTCLELAKVIEYFIENNIRWEGIRHIYSPRSINKYQLVSYINDIYELGNVVIPVEKEYSNKCLSGEKIDYEIKDIYDQIREQRIFFS